MPISYPDVSLDFPKLIRTLASFKKEEFDYWDDLVVGIYNNRKNKSLNIQSYFKKIQWANLDKSYPTCPEISSDWFFIKDRYVTNVGGTRYKVEKDALMSGPLNEYAKNEKIPILLNH